MTAFLGRHITRPVEGKLAPTVLEPCGTSSQVATRWPGAGLDQDTDELLTGLDDIERTRVRAAP